MLKTLSRLLTVTLFLSLIPTSFTAYAADTYVSDDVFVYLHSGPGNRFRIIGTLNAGTPVTVIGEIEDEFIQVRDDRDREGWIKAQWIQNTPSLRIINQQLSTKVEQLQSQLGNTADNAQQLQQQLDALQDTKSTLTQQLQETEQKLEATKKTLDNYNDKTNMEWFIRGGAVAGIGLLAGVILSFLLRRKKRRDDWV